MKKIVAIAFASAAMISTAFAGEIEGIVKSYDAATASIELESGEVFTVGEGIAVDAISTGKSVTITFDDGSTVATDVVVEE